MFQVIVLLLCFGSFYVGIIIRHVALPRKGRQALLKQLLLGIPVSLGVVGTFTYAFSEAFSSTDSGLVSLLTTLGVIMEHGMIVNETITTHMARLLSSDRTTAV